MGGNIGPNPTHRQSFPGTIQGFRVRQTGSAKAGDRAGQHGRRGVAQCHQCTAPRRVDSLPGRAATDKKHAFSGREPIHERPFAGADGAAAVERLQTLVNRRQLPIRIVVNGAKSLFKRG